MAGKSFIPSPSMNINNEDELNLFVQDVSSEEDESAKKPQFFSCLGQVNPNDFDYFCHQSRLKGGDLVRLLKKNFGVCKPSTLCCELFGMVLPNAVALTVHLQAVFAMAKRQIFFLRHSTEETSQTIYQGTSSSMLQIRREICIFLDFIKTEICRWLELISCGQSVQISMRAKEINISDYLVAILKEFHGLLLFMGRLSDLPDCILQNGVSHHGNMCSSAVYHYYHIYLDVWWSFLQILHLLSSSSDFKNSVLDVQFCKVQQLESENIFSQGLLLLLWDLCYIGARKFAKISQEDYFKVSPFSCTCCQELWTMIILLLESRQESLGEDFFWVYLHRIFKELITLKSVAAEPNVKEMTSFNIFYLIPDRFPCDNSVSFCLWLMSNVVPLYQFNVTGHPRYGNLVQSNYYDAKELVNQALQNQIQQKNELDLRGVLICCLRLSRYWEPSVELLIPLTDFFLKRLDDTFEDSRHGIQSFSFEHKTGMSWTEQIKERTTEPKNWNMSATSFQLYLCLFKLQLQRSMTFESESVWKQIKGRVYTKFYPKKLLGLTEIGLQNCFSLFLTLACAADLDDVSKKICDITDFLHEERITLKKREIAWQALFALALVCQERSCDMSVVSSKLAKYFSDTCREYQQSQDVTHQRKLMSLLISYQGGLQEVFSHSSVLGNSEYLLLGSGFGQILMKCSSSEQGHILTVIGDIITQNAHKQVKQSTDFLDIHGLNVKKQHQTLASFLYEEILPSVRTLSNFQTPLPQLADIAAGLTILMLELPASSNDKAKEGFSDVFSQFSISGKTSPVFCSRYLSHVLCEPEILDHLEKDIPTYQSDLIRTWLRCGIFIVPPDSQMQKLSSIVMKLPELSWIMPTQQSDLTSNHDYLIIRFFRSLSDQFNKVETVQEKFLLRQKIKYLLSDFVAGLTSVSKVSGSQEAVSHIFSLAGHLFCYCAPTLYVKSQPDCLLPVVIDTLILPRVLYSKDTTLTSTVMFAVKENLPLFIHGLYQLGISSDPYIQRKLRELIIQYLPKFSLKTSTTSSVTHHPLLTGILEICENQNSQDFVTFFVEVIRDNFLSKKGTSVPDHLQQAVLFLMELFTRAEDFIKIRIVTIVFGSVLDLLLNCENSSILPHLKDFMKVVLSATHKPLQTCNYYSVILEVTKTFVRHHLPWATGKTFKVLEFLLNLSPTLITNIVSVLTKTVEEIEEKRGVGQDNLLRQRIHHLFSKLQESSSSLKKSV
ncbi:protein MMS22-like isoform X3 [Tachypleus tridentatus]|uniref:protein MMS22-like isoform X3 n=1 Tax=Tachypleus tridentatus TaxID=6853 RepID=UPI003FD390F7